MEAHASLQEEADTPFARADIDPRAEHAQVQGSGLRV